MKNSTNRPNELSAYVKRFRELSSVFNSLPDGIVATMDAENNIATANKAVADLFQLPPKDILGKNIFKLLEKRQPHLVELLEMCRKTGQGIRNFTMDINMPSGNLSSFLVTIAVITGTTIQENGILLVLHDVSEIVRLRKIALLNNQYGELIGKSDIMKRVYGLIETVSKYNASVLITGETGTGKELVARAIHYNSQRKDNSFVPVNCSALPDNLIESELFGHLKGAFTGAHAKRVGRFELADGGTLFLDEVGTLAMGAQAKLLRALQEKLIEPVGASESKEIDVRIVSATNRNLSVLVAKNEFRDDLYYRLKVIQIDLPPLRERKEDIPILVEFFIKLLNTTNDKSIVGVSQSAEKLLMNYLWPGNVRELQHAIEHAFILTQSSFIEIMHLPHEIRFSDQNGAPPPPTLEAPDELGENIRQTLLAAKGNVAKAAGTLGMHRSTLWRKMREFGIDKGFGKTGSKTSQQ